MMAVPFTKQIALMAVPNAVAARGVSAVNGAPQGPAAVLQINPALQGRRCFSNYFGFWLLTFGPWACEPTANERLRRCVWWGGVCWETS